MTANCFKNARIKPVGACESVVDYLLITWSVLHLIQEKSTLLAKTTTSIWT